MKLQKAISYLALLSSPALINGQSKVHLRANANNVNTKSSDPSLEASLHLIKAIEAVGESTCVDYKSPGECSGSVDSDGVQCVWCKCAAIPSECLSVEQSKNVPPGVFQCDSEVDLEEEKEVGIPVVVEEEKNDIVGDRVTLTADIHPSPLTYLLEGSEVDGSVCDPDSKSISGYIDISGSKYDASGENKHLFYWFFEKRSSSSKVQEDGEIPLILWLTGGPGCSSTLALLTENGPCSVTEDGESTEVNPFSWTETAHVLWLDQPAGVGYSYGKTNDYNEEMISEDAYYFLQQFLKEHPEYSSNPLFVVGESYGGHYAPAIAHKVWTKNKNVEEGLISINLGGLAIGNGLTDPIEQYKWYPEMAYHNSHGIKTVSEDTYNAMKGAVDKCVSLIEECNKGDSLVNKFACQTAFVACNLSETSPYQMTGLNPYDIRLKCGDNPLCYDFSNVEKWLNLDSTKEALHISNESHHWQSCNMGINFKFHTDWMKDFSPFVKDLLNDGIPALIYAGDVDFICNYMGNRAWTLNLDWKHGEEFRDAEEHEWDVDGDAAGLARTSNGFTFMQVYDAGHMVPSDQPEVALKMIQNFVEGGDF